MFVPHSLTDFGDEILARYQSADGRTLELGANIMQDDAGDRYHWVVLDDDDNVVDSGTCPARVTAVVSALQSMDIFAAGQA